MEEHQNPEKNGAEVSLRAIGEGRTVAEAETQAIASLQDLAGPVSRDEIVFTVISEGSRGFLGVGAAVAKVEARLGDGEAAPAAEAGALAESRQAPPVDAGELQTAEVRLKEYLERVAGALGLEAAVSVRDEEEALVGSVDGGDMGIFIGRHGQTIDAVQYLANNLVFRGLQTRKRVVVDAEGYRQRRIEALHAMADRAVDDVTAGRSLYELKPMNPVERRIVHIYLQDRLGVETYSEGREPYRRVIIARSGNA